MNAALDHINRLDRAGFVVLLGALYEHSPWAAEAAFAHAPFAAPEALRDALQTAVDAAGAEARLGLIRAHPELAGEKLRARTLTAASMSEQADAGLDQLGDADLREWAGLNAAYRQRFGFPFIICVRLHSRDEILAAMRRRLGSAPDAEAAEAIRQIHDIARLRLDDLLARLNA